MRLHPEITHGEQALARSQSFVIPVWVASVRDRCQ